MRKRSPKVWHTPSAFAGNRHWSDSTDHFFSAATPHDRMRTDGSCCRFGGSISIVRRTSRWRNSDVAMERMRRTSSSSIRAARVTHPKVVGRHRGRRRFAAPPPASLFGSAAATSTIGRRRRSTSPRLRMVTLADLSSPFRGSTRRPRTKPSFLEAATPGPSSAVDSRARCGRLADAGGESSLLPRSGVPAATYSSWAESTFVAAASLRVGPFPKIDHTERQLLRRRAGDDFADQLGSQPNPGSGSGRASSRSRSGGRRGAGCRRGRRGPRSPSSRASRTACGRTRSPCRRAFGSRS